MTDWEHEFDHWCQKDHAEALLLKKYGHPKDEGCEAWHQRQLAAGVKYPHWDYPHWSGFSGAYLMKDKSNGMGTKDDGLVQLP